MNDNYILYTGYVNHPKDEYCLHLKYASLNTQEFFDIWYINTRKHIPENIPIHIVGPDCPDLSKTKNVKCLAEYKNLGYCADLIEKRTNDFLIGYNAGVVYGMIDAYVRGKDYLYKEQDCLAFGNYVDEIYKISGSHSVVIGPNKTQACSTALHFIKRAGIPYAISTMVSAPDAVNLLTEVKYRRMQNLVWLPFGYDRDRPFNTKDKIFYIQQVKKSELQILKDEKLI